MDDGPIHDFLTEPMPIPENSEADEWLDRNIKSQIPSERWRERCVITSAGWVPRMVLGAKRNAECAICEQPVWVSPSSAVLVGVACFVCSDCVTKAAEKDPT